MVNITKHLHIKNISLQEIIYIIAITLFIDLIIILFYINEENLQLPAEAVDNGLYNTELVV